MPSENPAYGGPFHDVPDEDMIVVNDRSEIPRFANEEEEAAFWETHTLAEHLWRKERGPRPGSLAERLSRQRFTPHALFNKEADAVYVNLAWGQTAKTRALDDSRLVNYDAAGNPIGVQLLHVSEGIDLRGIPERERIEDLIRDLNLHIFA